MADKRMFSQAVIDSDKFLDMSIEAQALYFHLGMRADDDGFVSSPKRIARMVGAGDAALAELIERRFLLSFESGIICIKHWRMNNYIQKDRYKPTTYREEAQKVFVKANRAYTLNPKEQNEPCVQLVYSLDTDCIQNGYADKISIDKYSIEEYREDKNRGVKRRKEASPAPSNQFLAMLHGTIENDFEEDDDENRPN